LPGKRKEDVKLRNIGVEQPLWDAAKAKAASEGRSLADAIREFLREYASVTTPR